MSSSAHDTQRTDDIGPEQEYLDLLYGRLAAERAQAQDRLAASLRETGGTPQQRSQRESASSLYADRLAQLDAVSEGLLFGRLDLSEPATRYIGRIGLLAEDRDADPLLVDWRAPAARAFYLATAASPQGVRRRRHIRTHGRRVTGVDDEVLDLGAARASGAREDVTGEAALLAALTAARTGRMRDIVETIQAEQDEVIRSPLAGVLVVQGGPGTGKTAVALHRAAYLLYTHRAQLTRHGVLVLGPNDTFLRYISQVLPSLAETGVLLSTLGGLFPGVTARASEPDTVAEIKGRLAMTGVLAAAVRDRQRVADLAVEVDGYELRVPAERVAAAREVARRTGRPHNLARPVFLTEVVHALSEVVAERIGADPLGGENLLDEADLAEIRRELRDDPVVVAAADELWPELTPQELLSGLYGAPERLAAAGADPALYRADDAWSPADVPLLDEAAELLGEDTSAAEAEAERRRRQDIEYAEGVLEIAAGSRSYEFEDEGEERDEQLHATDLVSASRFAERHALADRRTAAERAAADRTWAFGHVIVDEAQELSPMAWRLLMRRCPSRSMTVVGDVAQTSDLSGATSWADVFEPYVSSRWRLTELSVNYRTPAEVMAVAADVLAAIDPALGSAPAVRSAGVDPWARRVAGPDLAAEVVAAARAEAAAIGAGRLGVVVPAALVDELAPALTAALPGVAVGEQPDLLNRVVLLSVKQAKGLEFDAVLLVEPDRIVADSPRGLSDLYVAVTRTTNRLGVLHTAALPKELSALETPAPALSA
ncbi:DNA helicase [Spirilliplanes yamanashiensis]|uniref:DNA helicase n=1 Tax=Spirilliplanes yamanashiensis TaxID=42233 RepID=A0A8J4DLP5_9ACTN|nr:DNA helicase IV [Spirilliplanes yamanashiensis]GIJ05310.1 DNA helicase [Spirilliplanes yamanashiensis]